MVWLYFEQRMDVVTVLYSSVKEHPFPVKECSPSAQNSMFTRRSARNSFVEGTTSQNAQCSDTVPLLGVNARMNR